MAQNREDCYFYYYSTCKKGATCSFRHEPLSRGTEAICEDWGFGKCVKEHCNFRHTRELVNRSAIACYWELQPAGCQKAHCAFRHLKPKKAKLADAITTPTDDLDNAPSPKIDQILIHVTDTDDESPQKARKNQLTVSHVEKVATDKRVSADAEGDNSLTTKDSSQALEEELLEIAKKGICMLGGPDQPPLSVHGKPAIRTRSLKDIKREKVLRARLQYERKRQQVAQQHPDISRKGEETEEKKEKVYSANLAITQPPSSPHPGGLKQTSTTKRPSAPNDLSQVEVPAEKAPRNGGNEIKVKSFSEIMAEKRQRLKNDSKETLVISKPIIAPRKINIRSANSKRKPAVNNMEDAHVPKAESEELESNLPLVEDSQVSANVIHGSPEQSSNSPVEGQLDNEEEDLWKKPPFRYELDVNEELDLLGNSAQFSSGMTADIDDDELMNEMDQLLA